MIKVPIKVGDTVLGGRFKNKKIVVKCMECRKQKAREWQIRMCEEIKENKNGKFITFTFSNESIIELMGALEIKVKFTLIRSKVLRIW